MSELTKSEVSEFCEQIAAAIDERIDRDDYLDAGSLAEAVLDGFLIELIESLNEKIDFAHDALSAVYESGVSDEYTDEMIRKGLSGLPQAAK